MYDTQGRNFLHILQQLQQTIKKKKKTMTLKKKKKIQSGIYFSYVVTVSYVFIWAGWIVAALSGRAARQEMVMDAGFYYVL